MISSVYVLFCRFLCLCPTRLVFRALSGDHAIKVFNPCSILAGCLGIRSQCCCNIICSTVSSNAHWAAEPSRQLLQPCRKRYCMVGRNPGHFLASIRCVAQRSAASTMASNSSECQLHSLLLVPGAVRAGVQPETTIPRPPWSRSEVLKQCCEP